jgi:hypothetical protein
MGELSSPRVTAISDPASRDGDFPDVVCWDDLSAVCALPVEVKPAAFTDADLLDLEQGRRYARTFGGGQVLLTNLREFIWCELEGSALVERDRVILVDEVAAFAGSRPNADPAAARRLLEMLRAAWTVRPNLYDARSVAQLLGYHAQRMSTTLEGSPDPGALLRPLTTSLREGLGMELEERFLVGTVVQTLVYGLFAAWLESEEPQTFKWQQAPHGLGIDIIANLLHEASSPAVVRDTKLAPHLQAVARVLNWVDRDRFEAQFGAVGGGAIEYFYEPFLAAFDPELRSKLGVWYTPRAVAEYQVRRVDRQLRADFGLADGLADEQAIVLDPACGTGTYLIAVLRHIYLFHVENGEPLETAARRTLRAAHTRIIGFEILPAAFVVCYLHLHRFLTRELGATDVDEHRLSVFLCNALIGWGEGASAPPLPLPGLEAELQASLRVKGEEPVLVVLGNPPYEGYSAQDNPEEQELARPWIDPLWPVWRVRKHRLGGLYVRFWRIALRKISELTGRGIVCYITNRKWLNGRSFPAMRGDVLNRFDRLIVDDLGGDVRGEHRSGEGSVFSTATAPGIRVGVAIATAVRTGPRPMGSVADVETRVITGTGGAKRETLERLRDGELDAGLVPSGVSAAGRWRITAEDETDAPGLDEYFTDRWSGVQPVRDEAVTDSSRQALEARMGDYFDFTLGWDELVARHPAFGVERKRYDGERVRERHRSAGSTFAPDRVVRFLYRPLQPRWLYWEPRFKLLNEARVDLVPQHALEGQRYLAQPETPRKPGAARPVVTGGVPAFACADPDARVFPRVRITPRDDGTFDLGPDPTPETNLEGVWITAARILGLEGTDFEIGDVVFYALTAILYSPAWAAAVLPDQDTFPAVPLPADPTELREAARQGRRVAALADPDVPVEGVSHGRIEEALRTVALPDDAGGRLVTVGSRARGVGGRWVEQSAGKVLWNDRSGWTGVSEDLWSYTVGGFPVLAKWLSYRVGSMLSGDDLDQFTALARRVAALIELGPELDRLYSVAGTQRLEAPSQTAPDVVSA